MAEQLARELRVFYELARVVGEGPLVVDHVLERVCGEIRAAFGFERALLARYNPDEDGVHAVVQQGVDWPGDEWLPIAWFPFLQQALESGRAVHVRDARAEHAVPEEILERFGVNSVVAAPLLIEGRCLGFVVADRRGHEFELTARDLELLTVLCFVAAVFIDKADQYAQLADAHAELRELDYFKSDFISVASHELRTPIAVVTGIASTLHFRGGELREEQRVQLRETLYEQTVRLRDLVEQLLDLSRIDAGAIPVRPTSFRPREACDELLPQIVPDRLGDVHVEIDPALEITTDRACFERVVSNLVTNALRYGRPPVVVRCSSDEPFRLEVEDCGEGVDPAFVPRLYERFARSERPRAAAESGAGLGLAIANSFAEALGGRLDYEQADPHGARFVLSLPERAAA